VIRIFSPYIFLLYAISMQSFPDVRYHEADMRTGKATYWQLTSLQAFWPGVQVITCTWNSTEGMRNWIF